MLTPNNNDFFNHRDDNPETPISFSVRGSGESIIGPVMRFVLKLIIVLAIILSVPAGLVAWDFYRHDIYAKFVWNNATLQVEGVLHMRGKYIHQVFQGVMPKLYRKKVVMPRVIEKVQEAGIEI